MPVFSLNQPENLIRSNGPLKMDEIFSEHVFSAVFNCVCFHQYKVPTSSRQAQFFRNLVNNGDSNFKRNESNSTNWNIERNS